MRHTVTGKDTPLEPEEITNRMVHTVTKEIITKYKQLIDDLVMGEVWSKAICKELGISSQGYGEKGLDYHTEGINTMRP